MRDRKGEKVSDWDDLKCFLAIARHGTLSAAARALGVTQSTMGRRLESLHVRMGVTLLQKTPTGYVLTPAGERILPVIERMDSDAHVAERAVSGEDSRLEGLVRVTAVEMMSGPVIAPILCGFQSKHPNVLVELIADRRSLSLAQREADIALRLGEFAQHDVIVRKVAELDYGIYAAPEYLRQNGMPDFSIGAPNHHVITLSEDLASLPEARWFAERTRSAKTCFKSSSRYAQLKVALAGIGLACMPRFFADAVDGLERLPVEHTPRRGVWVGVHRDLRNTPRIKVVADYLAEGLRRALPALSPDGVAPASHCERRT